MPIRASAGVCRGGACLQGQPADFTRSKDVALVINTFERTIHQVLRPGFFSEIEDQNRHHFAE